MKVTTGPLLAAVLSAAVLMSCKNNDRMAPGSQKADDTREISEEHNEAKFETRAQEKDAQFLVDAATISMEEVRLGQLAASNAKLKEVKDLAQMLVTDHQKIYDGVGELAAKKQVTIPTAMPAEVKNDADKMSGKMGKEFDTDYCDKMVEAHKDAITKFERASTDAADADIRNWASETLPVLRRHLDHAMACRDKSDKVYK